MKLPEIESDLFFYEHKSKKANTITTILIFVAAIALFVVSSCAPANQAPRSAPTMSDSADLPVDEAVYLIKGKIAADLESFTRQVEPMQAYARPNYATLTGPVIDGKTLLTIEIEYIGSDKDEAIRWVSRGQTLAIKCVDSKCQVLRPGMIVEFMCRRQYEALARSEDEAWDVERLATWEVDYCRLKTGVIEFSEVEQ